MPTIPTTPSTVQEAYWDDRFNPIVVLEMRKAVRSSMLTGMFLICLAIFTYQSCTAMANLGGDQIDTQQGKELFWSIHLLLSAVGALFIPGYLGFQTALERDGGDSDLCLMTALTPAKYLWGKQQIALVLGMLVWSAGAPFLLFACLLGGVGIDLVVWSIAGNLMVLLAMTQVAICVGVIPVHIVVRLFLSGPAMAVGMFFLTFCKLSMSPSDIVTEIRFALVIILGCSSVWIVGALINHEVLHQRIRIRR
jgi:hypothetical protein